MQPFSPHAHFFFSLNQMEKRLELEKPSPSSTLSPPPPPPSPTPPPPPPTLEEAIDTQVDSLSSTIYLHHDQTNSITTITNSILEESEAPQEFLSSSVDFPPTQKNPFQEINEQNQETSNEVESRDLDDIELLMQLLGLSDEKELQRDTFSFGCEDEFYGKIVGVKGPKNVKELQRLEGWIRHFMNGGGEEKKEPLRLAHLVLAKAALLSSSEGSDEFKEFEFPSTVDDFLHDDPPTD